MMAEIDVVPKRRTSMWLWILLAVVVIAVLWFALGPRSVPARTGLNLTPVSTVAAQAIAGLS